MHVSLYEAIPDMFVNEKLISHWLRSARLMWIDLQEGNKKIKSFYREDIERSRLIERNPED